ncbi:MAG: hypothetical protein KF745_02725 [Phycisphaeraceae bacterium]|nr:hypothetical protein [Phycisphaeraceae bacterium]
MDRRTLTEGIKPPAAAAAGNAVDPVKEREFVYSNRPAIANAGPVVERVSITTRIRGDLAKALKRASLERQLSGTEPNTLQDMLEAAIEPWLRSNGLIR